MQKLFLPSDLDHTPDIHSKRIYTLITVKSNTGINHESQTMVNKLVHITNVVNFLILPLLSSRIDRVPKNNLRSLLPAFGAYSCPIILIQQGGYIKAMYSPINYTIWTSVQ